MDFIEQWFGLSPDGGDGSLEALYLMALVALIAALVFRRRLRRKFGSPTKLGARSLLRREIRTPTSTAAIPPRR